MPSAEPLLARQEDCSEKSHFLRDYQIALADYSRAVQVLSVRSGVMSKDQYSAIRDFAEKARARSEAVRSGLYRHLQLHGC